MTEDTKDARIAALESELAAYRNAHGPLVIGAEPVKCLACYTKTDRIAELESELAAAEQAIARRALSKPPEPRMSVSEAHLNEQLAKQWEMAADIAADWGSCGVGHAIADELRDRAAAVRRGEA